MAQRFNTMSLPRHSPHRSGMRSFRIFDSFPRRQENTTCGGTLLAKSTQRSRTPPPPPWSGSFLRVKNKTCHTNTPPTSRMAKTASTITTTERGSRIVGTLYVLEISGMVWREASTKK